MVDYLLDNLSVDRIHRIDVSFEIPDRYCYNILKIEILII